MIDASPDEIRRMVRELVLGDFREPAPPASCESSALWARVKQCGSELWLDTGDMDEIQSLWSSEFTALTTNNTLLNREVQKGIYDELIARVADELGGLLSEEALVLETAFVLNAHHALRLHRRFGARVSVELHTHLAEDVERTVWYGARYGEIGGDAFYVKVPLSAAGLLAARRLGEQGVPVNFTLGFSARENYLIAALARPGFVNVFLGRLNAFVADNDLGTGEMVGEKATLSSRRHVAALREERGLPTRQIAASMRDGAQVRALTGVDVLTMPPKVAREFEQLAPDPGDISSQAEHDPAAQFADEASAVGIEKLWDVPEAFRRVVDELAEGDLSGVTPADLVGHLARAGCGDVLPNWSGSDVAKVRADGKIPVLEHWRGRLAGGEIGLDALMTLSGLESFAADQAEMDERIRSML